MDIAANPLETASTSPLCESSATTVPEDTLNTDGMTLFSMSSFSSALLLLLLLLLLLFSFRLCAIIDSVANCRTKEAPDSSALVSSAAMLCMGNVRPKASGVLSSSLSSEETRC